MSFFNSFLNEFNVNDNDDIKVSMLSNVKIMFFGRLKVEDFSEDKIVIKSKEIIYVFGENLNIKSYAKGELVICGKIKCVKFGESYERKD